MTACAAVAALATSAVVQPAAADTISLYGSTTFNAQIMQPMQSAIEAKSGHKLHVVSNKSSLGIMALFEKRADMAMISSSLESQIAVLKRSNPALDLGKLQNFSVMQVRVAFAIHPGNPVKTVTLATLRKMLTGEIANWKAVGGADLPIRLVMVRDGGGVASAVESELLDGKPITATSHAIHVQNGTYVPAAVGAEPGALGLAQLGLLRKSKTPELKTDRPVEQHLNYVTLGDPTPAMRAVIAATQELAAARAERH